MCKAWRQLTADGVTAIRLAKRQSAGLLGSHRDGFDLTTIPLQHFSGLRSLEVVIAAYRSARDGVRVGLPLVF